MRKTKFGLGGVDAFLFQHAAHRTEDAETFHTRFVVLAWYVSLFSPILYGLIFFLASRATNVNILDMVMYNTLAFGVTYLLLLWRTTQAALLTTTVFLLMMIGVKESYEVWAFDMVIGMWAATLFVRRSIENVLRMTPNANRVITSTDSIRKLICISVLVTYVILYILDMSAYGTGVYVFLMVLLIHFEDDMSILVDENVWRALYFDMKF